MDLTAYVTSYLENIPAESRFGSDSVPCVWHRVASEYLLHECKVTDLHRLLTPSHLSTAPLPPPAPLLTQVASLPAPDFLLPLENLYSHNPLLPGDLIHPVSPDRTLSLRVGTSL